MIETIMKRDMDLIRAILLKVESETSGFAPSGNLEIDGYTQEEIQYHIWLLGEAGLAEIIETSHHTNKSPTAIIRRLTWDGHEFLDIARQNHVWNQAKDTINKVGGAAIAIWVAVLTGYIKQQLRIP